MATIAEIARNEVAGFLASMGLEKEPMGTTTTLVDGVLRLVDKLKAYQEEGKELRPEFLVFREVDHEALIKELELTHFFEVVSAEPRSPKAFDKAVKHCAPLATGVWAGFIKLQKNGTLAYGVVRRRYAVTDDRVVLQAGINKKLPFIWARQVERHVVELVGPDRSTRIALRATEPAPTSGPRDELGSVLTEKGFDAHKDGMKSLLSDVFDRTILHGHGFLVAVAHAEGEMKAFDELTKPATKPGFASGIWFEKWPIPTPLKIAELRDWWIAGERSDLKDGKSAEFIAEKVAQRYAEVEAWSELISSMLMSDGITWFDNAGRVLGYRMFISGIGVDDEGGARTKAFEALCKKVDEGALRAVYMQSQDGRAKFYSKQA